LFVKERKPEIYLRQSDLGTAHTILITASNSFNFLNLDHRWHQHLIK